MDKQYTVYKCQYWVKKDKEKKLRISDEKWFDHLEGSGAQWGM